MTRLSLFTAGDEPIPDEEDSSHTLDVQADETVVWLTIRVDEGDDHRTAMVGLREEHVSTLVAFLSHWLRPRPQPKEATP